MDDKEMTDLKEVIDIRDALSADAAAIAEIYNHYVNDTVITFEGKPVPPSEIDRRIREVRSLALPWLIAELNREIVGYAYASKWKERAAYRFSVEVTVYVGPDHVRHGIGLQLYDRLLPELKARGVHAAMAGIALPNDASVKLHEKLGFEKVAQFKEVGFKFDQWIDVGYWQRIL
ncbi:MAG TPA: N-acetyltransferase family protein [Syntrophales bacterium]|nr:N-acetyltransferase family protein [Syntrophales bacterium]